MGDRTAFVFLDEDGRESAALTFAELDRRARSIATELRRHAAPGDRVLLLHPPGLDYVASFYGCVYAGIIAVPLFPPLRGKLDNVETIARDCAASAVATTADVVAGMAALGAGSAVASLPRVATDAITGAAEPTSGDSAIAYLQYTSGSTSVPKGVIVDHAMSLEQCAELAFVWALDSESTIVSWLPHFHDFGQLSGVLLPVFAGIRSVLMAPSTFVKNPVRWLDAVTAYRGTHSGAPNFAYDLCVDKTTPEQRAQLDLSTWRMLANGAEPVRAATLERFQATFAPAGLNDTALSPGYGLAEATLKVTCSPVDVPFVIRHFDTEALGQRRVEIVDGADATVLAGNGGVVLQTQLEIVDPETFERMPEGEVGEIWVRGPIVSPGYWNRPQDTERTFQARIAGGAADEYFLRTGDLGFVYEHDLFICGRVKNLMIVNGVNYYLEDIEATVVGSHDALRAGSVIAFAVQRDGLDRLVVVAEHRDEQACPAAQLVSRIYDAVARRHGVSPEAIVLITYGSVPRTTSGKLRRQHCRDDYLAGRLTEIHRWAEETSTPEAPEAPQRQSVSMRDLVRAGLRSQIDEWMRRTNGPDTEFDATRSLAEHGFGSVDQMRLHEELENWSGRRFPPELMWDAESIDDMTLLIADHIAVEREKVTTRVGA